MQKIKKILWPNSEKNPERTEEREREERQLQFHRSLRSERSVWPTIETGDLISTTVEFAAHGSDLLTGDEMKVKYLGSTSHTQTGYAASGSGDRSVAA